jgi:hypothetical protein
MRNFAYIAGNYPNKKSRIVAGQEPVRRATSASISPYIGILRHRLEWPR